MADPQRVIVTGGPGAGKSTLLAALAERGYPIMQDSAREIIRARKAQGLSPRPEPAEFANQILRRDIEQYRSARPGIVFYERGIPDALGMLLNLRIVTESEARASSATYRYLTTVLVLPPWGEIYVTDDERDQTFADSVRVHNAICDWYARLDYELVEVQPAPIEDRCRFVLERLDCT